MARDKAMLRFPWKQSGRSLFALGSLSWRDPDGARFHVVAFSYVALSYTIGIFAIVSSSFIFNLAGILLLAHSLVIAAYLLHECAHHSVFISAPQNARLGSVLAWLTGACYSGFERVRRKHLRHHVEQADILAWDYRGWLSRHAFARDVVELLESLWLPAVELLMHIAAIILPFVDAEYRERRAHIIKLLLIRGALLFILAWIQPWAPVYYAVAYLLFMQVLRFMDVFQHSYLLRFTLTSPLQRAKNPAVYEESHTFSNLLSSRWPMLNLLVLNFCYHNIHHQQPLLSWYRLPQRHREMYGDVCPQQIGFSNQLRWFHRYRRERVMAAVDDSQSGPMTPDAEMVGATGVSFVTAI